MTHILITDLREIRYMAYVPEEPKYCTDLGDSIIICGNTFCTCDRQLKGYRADLEKAKRESIEFDRGADKHALYVAIRTKYMKETDSLFELKPGIYQVPVEKPEIVDVFEKLSKEQYESPENQNRDNPITGYMKKVARLKSSEPKEESQEDVVRDFFMEYNRLMQGGRPQHSAALKLLDKFNVTRKRG